MVYGFKTFLSKNNNERTFMRDICFCLGISEAVVSFKFWRELQEIQCIYQFSISINVIVPYPFLCIHFVTKNY